MNEGFNYRCPVCEEIIDLREECPNRKKFWHISGLGFIISPIKNLIENIYL